MDMATHSSIAAWKTPWTAEPGRLQAIGSQRVGHNWSDLACVNHMQLGTDFPRWKWSDLIWYLRRQQNDSVGHSVMSNFLQPHELYSPWNSPGQNTGVGSLSLFQGILPTQGLNTDLPHCRQILYHLSWKGSPVKHDGAQMLWLSWVKVSKHT